MASCKVMMCHFAAMCFSTAPSFPRRGPGFQLQNALSSDWAHQCRSSILRGMEGVSSLVPRETQDLRPSRRQSGDRLVWTRRLRQSQMGSLRPNTPETNVSWCTQRFTKHKQFFEFLQASRAFLDRWYHQHVAKT